MNLDECTVYVFVRQDLPIEQQLVQGAHALFRSRQADYSPACSMASGAMTWPAENLQVVTIDPEYGHPNIIFVGMPNLKALQRVEAKLVANKIKHSAWTEPDFDLGGISAIATQPLSRAEKQVLSNYRLWRYSPDTPAQGIGLNADRGANAVVAQLREHSVSNRGVAGVNPADGSRFDRIKAAQ